MDSCKAKNRRNLNHQIKSSEFGLRLLEMEIRLNEFLTLKNVFLVAK